MNKTKLFLSDVDGTLLKTRQPLSPKVPNSIKRFIDSGGYFSISTGRGFASVLRLLRTIPVNAPCVLCGGAVIYDFNSRRTIRSISMGPDALHLAEVVLRHYKDVSVTATTPAGVFNLRKNDRLMNRGVEEDSNAPMAFPEDLENPVKLLFTCDSVERLHQVEDLFLRAGAYTFKFASTYFCEVTALGADKGSSISFLQRELGNCRVFSAGDAMSDLEMASVSELFFAPETAPELVQKHADRLFPSPVEGGIADALKYVMEL